MPDPQNVAPAARTGDWVRAREDSRDRPVVEGVLQIRYVPSLDYAQVLVLGYDGRSYDVEPDSVEVLRPAAVPVEELEKDAWLRSDPRWRRIADLDQARAEGLVQTTRARTGGTWADMLHRLDAVVAPLLPAGWRVVEDYTEESWEYGDSVAYDLQRADERIEVELYEDGQIDVWRLGESDEGDDEPTTPLLKLDFGDTDEARREAFHREGWIDRPQPTH